MSSFYVDCPFMRVIGFGFLNGNCNTPVNNRPNNTVTLSWLISHRYYLGSNGQYSPKRPPIRVKGLSKMCIVYVLRDVTVEGNLYKLYDQPEHIYFDFSM